MTTTISAEVTGTIILSYPAAYPDHLEPLTWQATWHNLGPLSTTFTPPSQCTPTPHNRLLVLDTSPDDDDSNDAWSCTYSWNLDCQPSAEKLSAVPTYIRNYWVWYFSPGIHCPSGYTSAHVTTIDPADVNTAVLGGSILRTAATHVQCCPRDYFFSRNICYHSPTTTFTTTLCPIPFCSTCAELIDAPPTAFAFDPKAETTGVKVLDMLYPVYMIHQESDVPRRGNSVAIPVGVGVGIAVVLLASMVLGVLCWRKRSRTRRREALEQRMVESGKESSRPRNEQANENDQLRGNDQARENDQAHENGQANESVQGPEEEGNQLLSNKLAASDRRWHWI